MNEITERPWGTYRIIEESDKYKIKEIIVNPGKRLSLQIHKFRDETWKIITGKAKIDFSFEQHPNLLSIVIDSDNLEYFEDSCVYIKRNELHRIENIGETPLIFIEIQTGFSFDESDIIRIEDDFGRN